MSAIAPITLMDGQATPVAHVFSPIRVIDGIASFADKSSGVPIGYPVLTYQMRQPTKALRSYKQTSRLLLPVLEATSPSTATGIQPAPTVAFTPLVNIETVLPDRMTYQNRKDLLAYVKSYVNGAVFASAILDLEDFY